MTALEKTIRRALRINGAEYVLTLTPQGLKLTLKKKRNGLELAWADLVDGEAALATALNASLGQLDAVPRKKVALQSPAPRKQAHTTQHNTKNETTPCTEACTAISPASVGLTALVVSLYSSEHREAAATVMFLL